VMDGLIAGTPLEHDLTLVLSSAPITNSITHGGF
jgi:hypothetical protein